MIVKHRVTCLCRSLGHFCLGQIFPLTGNSGCSDRKDSELQYSSASLPSLLPRATCTLMDERGAARSPGAKLSAAECCGYTPRNNDFRRWFSLLYRSQAPWTRTFFIWIRVAENWPSNSSRSFPLWCKWTNRPHANRCGAVRPGPSVRPQAAPYPTPEHMQQGQKVSLRCTPYPRAAKKGRIGCNKLSGQRCIQLARCL